MKNSRIKKMNTGLWLEGEQLSEQELIENLRMGLTLKPLIKEVFINRLIENIELSEERLKNLVTDFKKSRGLDNEDKLNTFLDENLIDESLLESVLSRPEKIVTYREERWGHRINSLYLKNKDNYDLITYKRLESQD